jgi:hypothetical protein
LAITTQSTTTSAPTRKATIVQAMASRLTGSAPRCPLLSVGSGTAPA